jgi:hypothetical protein
LLVGREDLEDSEIKDNEIGDDKIEDDEIENNEEDIRTANYEKFFLNYTDRCAVSIYFANLIINKAAIETTNTY